MCSKRVRGPTNPHLSHGPSPDIIVWTHILEDFWLAWVVQQSERVSEAPLSEYAPMLSSRWRMTIDCR